MDHSLQSYIARQSTEVLWDSLRWLLGTKERIYSNRYGIVLTLRELEKRDRAEAGVASPKVEQAWRDFTQGMAEVAAENFE